MFNANSKRHLRLRNTYRAIKHAIKKILIGVVSVIGYGLLQSDNKIHSLVSVCFQGSFNRSKTDRTGWNKDVKFNSPAC